MTISFVCILVLSACCQNCFADPGKSIQKNLLPSLDGVVDGVLGGLSKTIQDLLKQVLTLLQDLLTQVGELLGGLLNRRASKIELSPSSIEKMNHIEDVYKQIDVMLDKVEAKCKEEGIYDDVRRNLDVVKGQMKTFEKEMQKISGKKQSGSGGLLSGILG